MNSNVRFCTPAGFARFARADAPAGDDFAARLAAIEKRLSAIENGAPSSASANAALPEVRTGNDTRAARLAPQERSALDARMGVPSGADPIRREGRTVIFGTMTPEQARARLARR